MSNSKKDVTNYDNQNKIEKYEINGVKNTRNSKIQNAVTNIIKASYKYTEEIKKKFKANSLLNEFESISNNQFKNFLDESNRRYSQIKSGVLLDHFLTIKNGNSKKISKKILENEFFRNYDIQKELNINSKKNKKNENLIKAKLFNNLQLLKTFMKQQENTERSSNNSSKRSLRQIKINYGILNRNSNKNINPSFTTRNYKHNDLKIIIKNDSCNGRNSINNSNNTINNNINNSINNSINNNSSSSNNNKNNNNKTNNNKNVTFSSRRLYSLRNFSDIDIIQDTDEGNNNNPINNFNAKKRKTIIPSNFRNKNIYRIKPSTLNLRQIEENNKSIMKLLNNDSNNLNIKLKDYSKFLQDFNNSVGKFKDEYTDDEKERIFKPLKNINVNLPKLKLLDYESPEKIKLRELERAKKNKVPTEINNKEKLIFIKKLKNSLRNKNNYKFYHNNYNFTNQNTSRNKEKESDKNLKIYNKNKTKSFNSNKINNVPYLEHSPNKQGNNPQEVTNSNFNTSSNAFSPESFNTNYSINLKNNSCRCFNNTNFVITQTALNNLNIENILDYKSKIINKKLSNDLPEITVYDEIINKKVNELKMNNIKEKSNIIKTQSKKFLYPEEECNFQIKSGLKAVLKFENYLHQNEQYHKEIVDNDEMLRIKAMIQQNNKQYI